MIWTLFVLDYDGTYSCEHEEYYGVRPSVPIIFIVHVVTDALKARWNKITYTQDQIIHYVIALIYLAF